MHPWFREPERAYEEKESKDEEDNDFLDYQVENVY